jgi:glycosyltransferase involved in cell wall biosynthesis
MENRLPLSVCMIAGNEAHRIRRALASVSGWASEIILVLNEEVADGTDKIALEFGARIFREPWKGFVGQKNSAAEKCSQPWLLNLDADEVVTPELQKEIAALVTSSSSLHAAYEFPRCTFYCARWIRHGDWYPDRVLRLWRRETGRWAGQEPHARLEINGTIGRLRSDLSHFSAETINHQIIKTMNYADDFARNCAREGKNVTFLDLLLRPVWRFWRAYLFRLGFLDGWQGFAIAWLTAFYTFLRYIRVRESQLPETISR